MSDTPHLGLPMLAAAQAQKHVTMNDALMRLDALSAPCVKTASLTAPPLDAVEGDTYLVAAPAADIWSGHEDELAFFGNGGWSFAAANPGWQIWVLDEGRHATFVGDRWVSDLTGGYQNGAFATMCLSTHDLELEWENVNLTPTMVPARSIVHCISARVIEEITGTAVDWRMGVLGASNRYGNLIGKAKDSTAVGLTSNPLAYYSDQVVRIAPNGGLFSGGRIRISAHYTTFQPADAV